jgi:polyketide biosynthesis acyl carrier protein
MAKENVYEVVKNVIMEVIPDLTPEMISIDKSLKELGANSIDRMEVVTLSMEALKLKLPLMSFASVTNIEGLVDVLSEHYSAPVSE